MQFFKYLYLLPTIVIGVQIPGVVHQRLLQSPLKSALDDVKVPVKLGVMSRCPDTLLCESIFNQVLQHVAGKVDLSLVYIARLDSSEPNFGVKCMHGAEECAGNVQQLCVAKHQPPSVWWEFIQCQNYAGLEDIGTLDLAHKCAKIAGFDWEITEAGQCAGEGGSGKDAEGVRLLKESIASGQKLSIEKSCTILINDRKVCVHDGTWKECENGHTVNDFVKQINEEYDRLNKGSSSSSM